MSNGSQLLHTTTTVWIIHTLFHRVSIPHLFLLLSMQKVLIAGFRNSKGGVCGRNPPVSRLEGVGNAFHIKQCQESHLYLHKLVWHTALTRMTHYQHEWRLHLKSELVPRLCIASIPMRDGSWGQEPTRFRFAINSLSSLASCKPAPRTLRTLYQ